MTDPFSAFLRSHSQRGTDPYALAFDAQRRALEDTGKRKALLCGRRSGKTRTVLMALWRAAVEHPRAIVPYVCLSRPVAKRILWPTIKEAVEQLEIDCVMRESDLSVRFPNHSQLVLLGADKPSEVNKLRGQKFPAAAVDEPQAFRDDVLRELVDEVLEPTLLDYRGTLWMGGTPGARCAGYFHDLTLGKLPGWKVYHWTVLDNPTIPHAAEWLAELCERRGWTPSNPTYRREYLGEWVRDDDALVYRFSRARDLVTELPADYTRPQDVRWDHALGIDFGFVDDTAWVLLAHRARVLREQDTPLAMHTVYVPWSDGEPGLTPSAAGKRTQALVEQHRPSRLVGDAGGLGKAFVEEARERFGLSIEAAEKPKKAAYIELLNDAFISQRLKVLESANAGLIHELETVQWDEARRAEDPRFSNHRTDALLYGWRAVRAHLAPEVVAPAEHAPEYDRRLEAGWLAAQRRSRKPAWWDQ